MADTLRQAREEHGQDLLTVAQVLRIRYVYLEAIESGEFDQLPGTAYAIGFLRTYAEFLGLDSDEIIERFKQETGITECKPVLQFPEPMSTGRIPGGAIILISALLLGLVYGGWFYLSSEDRNVADLIPAPPEQLQTLAAGEANGALESASLDQPPDVGRTQASAPAAAATGSEAAVAEAPAPAEAGEFEVEPGTAANSESASSATIISEANSSAAGATDTIVESEPVVSFSEPESPTGDAVVHTAEVAPNPPPSEPVMVFFDAAGIQSEPAEPANSASAVSAPVPPPASEVTGAPRQPVVSATSEATGREPGSTGIATAWAAPAPSRQTAARAAPTWGDPSSPTWSPTMMTSPPVEETVVIPSPPTIPQAMAVSTDRAPRVYGEKVDGTRIVLHAVQDSWVQIRDRQDALLLTRVLRTGDIYYVPAQDGLTLLTGNAGGLEIEIDGVMAPPLGPLGMVRRQIILDPTRLLNGTAASR